MFLQTVFIVFILKSLIKAHDIYVTKIIGNQKCKNFNSTIQFEYEGITWIPFPNLKFYLNINSVNSEDTISGECKTNSKNYIITCDIYLNNKNNITQYDEDFNLEFYGEDNSKDYKINIKDTDYTIKGNNFMCDLPNYYLVLNEIIIDNNNNNNGKCYFNINIGVSENLISFSPKNYSFILKIDNSINANCEFKVGCKETIFCYIDISSMNSLEKISISFKTVTNQISSQYIYDMEVSDVFLLSNLMQENIIELHNYISSITLNLEKIFFAYHPETKYLTFNATATAQGYMIPHNIKLAFNNLLGSDKVYANCYIKGNINDDNIVPCTIDLNKYTKPLKIQLVKIPEYEISPKSNLNFGEKVDNNEYDIDSFLEEEENFCIENCELCDESKNNICQKCKSGYYINIDNNNGVTTCLKCPDECETCVSETECNKCKDGFELINTKCILNFRKAPKLTYMYYKDYEKESNVIKFKIVFMTFDESNIDNFKLPLYGKNQESSLIKTIEKGECKLYEQNNVNKYVIVTYICTVISTTNYIYLSSYSSNNAIITGIPQGKLISNMNEEEQSIKEPDYLFTPETEFKIINKKCLNNFCSILVRLYGQTNKPIKSSISLSDMPLFGLSKTESESKCVLSPFDGIVIWESQAIRPNSEINCFIKSYSSFKGNLGIGNRIFLEGKGRRLSDSSKSFMINTQNFDPTIDISMNIKNKKTNKGLKKGHAIAILVPTMFVVFISILYLIYLKHKTIKRQRRQEEGKDSYGSEDKRVSASSSSTAKVQQAYNDFYYNNNKENYEEKERVKLRSESSSNSSKNQSIEMTNRKENDYSEVQFKSDISEVRRMKKED